MDVLTTEEIVPARTAGKTDVYHLNDESVDEFLDSQDRVLLAIVHPMAPRCQRFFPVFEKVAHTLVDLGSTIICGQIEVGGKPGLAARFSVTAFPTVLLCQGSGSFKTYNGVLQEQDIIAFLERQTMAAITVIHDNATLNDMRRKHDVVVVGFLDPDDAESSEHFAALAEEMRDDYVFCHVSGNKTLAEMENVHFPSVVVYKTAAETKIVYEGPWSPSATMGTFIKNAIQPLVAEFFPETHEKYLEAPLPIGYLLVSSTVQKKEGTETLLPLARKYHGKMRFGTVDIATFSSLRDTMLLTKKGREEEIDHFIASFLSGKLTPNTKSATIPAHDPSSAIIEVVGVTYDSVILDPTRDVLVEFYTPWCGPYKVLLPEYQRLARLYASHPQSEARGKVTIAKLNIEANDVPDCDIRAVPWFKLYPAGNKREPVTFEGGRKVAAWAEFVRNYGTHGVELELSGEEGEDFLDLFDF